MPPCSVSNKGHCCCCGCLLLLLLVLLLCPGTGGRVHMLYWNASNPLLTEERGAGELQVNMNLDEQQYDQVPYTP